MAFPEPEVGLVVSYSYLWSDEAAAGHVEGRKARPSAIVMAVRHDEEHPAQIAVVPITHSPHSDPQSAIEIPPRVADNLGLDGDRSWVVLDELNFCTWPGYDLRQVPGEDGRYDYGFLPPNFFESLVTRFTELRQSGRIEATSRDDVV